MERTLARRLTAYTYHEYHLDAGTATVLFDGKPVNPFSREEIVEVGWVREPIPAPNVRMVVSGRRTSRGGAVRQFSYGTMLVDSTIQANSIARGLNQARVIDGANHVERTARALYLAGVGAASVVVLALATFADRM